MKIRPLGFYVLIEMEKVEEVTAGGIILNTDMVSKEQDATDVGYVRAIGPTAYHGYPGCDREAHIPESKRITDGVVDYDMKPVPPAECWGLEIGQKIEYRRFEGKKSVVEDYENYRYIPDSHIIGAIDDE
jgi:co-chaperonin GroES (HSP10)